MSSRTAVSKSIGTSAGYVSSYDNSITLNVRVLRDPRALILLVDSIKASPQIITLLLQVVDTGGLREGHGIRVDFKNAAIITTSKAGFGNDRSTGDEDKDMKIMDRTAPYYSPESLNRCNVVIVSTHLTKDDLNDIVDPMLNVVIQSTAKKGMDLELNVAAKARLITASSYEAMGVRPPRGAIFHQNSDLIADYFLDHLYSTPLFAVVVDATIVTSERQEFHVIKD